MLESSLIFVTAISFRILSNSLLFTHPTIQQLFVWASDVVKQTICSQRKKSPRANCYKFSEICILCCPVTVIRRQMAPPFKKRVTWGTLAAETWRLRLCKVRSPTRHQRACLLQSPTQLTNMDSARKAHTCQLRHLYLTLSWGPWNWSPKRSQAQAQT